MSIDEGLADFHGRTGNAYHTPGVRVPCSFDGFEMAVRAILGPLPPVAFHGTPFQEEVWGQLTLIPYGQLTTYGAIAHALSVKHGGARQSARAVGVAVGRNPISIVVPCHRVVGATGSLTGYAGGIARKVVLLKLEGIDVSKLKVPTKGTAL